MSAEDDHRLRSDGVHRPRVAHDFVGFDYEATEGASREVREIPREALIEAMRVVLTQFCMWQTAPDSLRPLTSDTVGMRSIAALWVLKPEAFDNASLHAISKRFGCSDSILSRYAGQFSDQFGVRSASQIRPGERAGAKRTVGTPPPRKESF
jgi:hypothetical protein